MRVGVLALQGDFAAHAARLTDLGAAVSPVRTAAELARVDALVFPGGESTAMLRLMEPEDLFTALGVRLAAGLPVLATCAGVILIAAGVRPVQRSLAALDVDVTRNAYGRQLHSSVAPVRLAAGLDGPATMEAVFIRAPRIERVGLGVEVLAHRDEDPVLVRQGAVLAATFHPELGADTRVHRWFLELVTARAA
jgi:5'-phosphate synthase pdxT subunit